VRLVATFRSRPGRADSAHRVSIRLTAATGGEVSDAPGGSGPGVGGGESGGVGSGDPGGGADATGDDELDDDTSR
jgi:hypothetical protein